MTRRSAIRVLGGALAALAVAAVSAQARTLVACDHGGPHGGHGRGRSSRRRAVKHPNPRPGVTAANVLPRERVPKAARKLYDRVREIPEVLDGIYCHCDCAERDGLRSLLSCFETKMPASCGICSRQAKLAHKLHRRGKSLDEIRAAVDAEFGD